MNYHRFKNLTELRQHSQKNGYHFFDVDTMRYWQSRVEGIYHSDSISNILITYEHFSEFPYTIRWQAPNGRTYTLHDFDKRYPTKQNAEDAIARFFLFGFPV